MIPDSLGRRALPFSVRVSFHIGHHSVKGQSQSKGAGRFEVRNLDAEGELASVDRSTHREVGQVSFLQDNDFGYILRPNRDRIPFLVRNVITEGAETIRVGSWLQYGIEVQRFCWSDRNAGFYHQVYAKPDPHRVDRMPDVVRRHDAAQRSVSRTLPAVLRPRSGVPLPRRARQPGRPRRRGVACRLRRRRAGPGRTRAAGARSDSRALAGLDFAALSERETIDYVLDGVAQRRGGWLVTANLDILRQWRAYPELRELIAGADLVVADGMPLIWAGAVARSPLPERVAGSNDTVLDRRRRESERIGLSPRRQPRHGRGSGSGARQAEPGCAGGRNAAPAVRLR